MTRLAAAIAGIILLSGCGVQSQQTPEPNETERVNQLVEQLGTDRSWDSSTQAPNPDPDGRVLLSWVSRRKATLNKTLSLTQLPALTNPGTVGDTLAWEREAKKAEASNSNAINNYMLDFEGRKARCPQSAAAEAVWYSQESAAHAKGLRNKLIPWDDVSTSYAEKCDAEAGAANATRERDEKAAQFERTRAIQEELACRAPYDAAHKAYLDDPSLETNSVVTSAAEVMNACMSETATRRQSPNEYDELP